MVFLPACGTGVTKKLGFGLTDCRHNHSSESCWACTSTSSQPADHRLNTSHRFVTGGGQVYMSDDERPQMSRQPACGKVPGRADRPGHWQPQASAVRTPHEDAGDHLKWQQYVQDAEVGDLLQRVEPFFTRLSQRGVPRRRRCL